MNKLDKNYKHLLKTILEKGEEYTDKSRGCIRKEITSYTIRHEMKDGFPLLTTKEVDFNCIKEELIWFLNGNTNVVDLIKVGVNIWNKDAYNQYKRNMYGFEDYHKFLSYEDFVKCLKMLSGKKRYPKAFEDYFWECIEGYVDLTGKEFGCAGKNYSYQWRNSNGKVDQIKKSIDLLISNPNSTRNVVEGWNPNELDETALPPCHKHFQIIGVGDKGFELHWNQRSVDTFLGLPFNIGSYGTLGLMYEKVSGRKFLALQGDLKCVHLYENQIEAAKKQITRKSHKLPTVELLEGATGNYFKNCDSSKIILHSYKHEDKIKIPMIAPKN